MGVVRLEDLSPAMQAQVRAKLGEPVPRKSKGNRASGVATNGRCQCGERFTSTRKWEKHSDASGHRRFDLIVNGELA